MSGKPDIITHVHLSVSISKGRVSIRKHFLPAAFYGLSGG